MSSPSRPMPAAWTVLFSLLLWTPAPRAQVYKDPKAPVAKRVEDLLQRMTLEEKIDYLGGYKGFYIRPIPRLGIPAIKMSDGPTGCRCYGKAAALPGGIILAATWDPEAARLLGETLGRECRARGVHILLGPGVNIYRGPLCGRDFEYFGEDPYLASQIVVPWVRGVQSQGVLATVKHYACNNQEYDRHRVSSELDEETLREIYLPAFRAAVTEGRVGCVMNAYNLINGVHCTQDPFLNNQILKKEWGFDGILMSDWGATYDGIAAALGGLDLEMPSGKFMNRKTLIPAVKSGKVPMAVIDDKVRRILRKIIQFGFLDRPQEIPSIPKYDPKSVRAALSIAREGIVLLKNQGRALPLERGKVRSIAVLGPMAHPAVWGGGGSAFTTPFRATSVLEGLTEAADPGVEVYYDRGIPELDENTLVKNARFSHRPEPNLDLRGLKAEYFGNVLLQGDPIVTGKTRRVDFDFHKRPVKGVPRENFSARFTGRITPEKTGTYIFVLRSDDGARLFLDGKPLLVDWSDHAARTRTARIRLEGGRDYPIRIEYYQKAGSAVLRLGWGLLSPEGGAPALRLAKACDAAVVCVGFGPGIEREGRDRPFALPAGQEELIRSVAAANKRTIVVLFSGGNVAMEGWIDKVSALVEAWYPGQEGGRALAEILLGDVNPSGKLPASFAKNWEDNPSSPYYHSKNGKTYYKERIFVGYRGFDKLGREPRFPFGFGLSYTTFSLSNLTLSSKEIRPGGSLRVSVNVRNTGTRPGAEVVQLYLQDVKASVPRPVKELKGFQKVRLAPGEEKTVTFRIGRREMEFFHPKLERWVVEPGAFRVLVGTSSRDLPLAGEFQVTAQ